jgi:hypothetical protein
MMNSMGNRARRALQGLSTGLALLALASCGGGTEQITPFDPTRYIVFGDEMSYLTADGRKYTVNALDSNGVPDCSIDTSSQPSRIWVQVLASAFRFRFAECNPNNDGVNGFIFAAPGAKVDDFIDQVAAARLSQGAFGCRDLMSVLLGANDVLDLFENVYLASPTQATANAVADELTARARRLGQAITDLTAGNGPNFVVSTIPLMNLTPYARQMASAYPNANVSNVLNRFSTAFNDSLRTNIPNDGTRWGLVELDALLNAGFNNPDTYGLNNVRDAVCVSTTWGTADCTTNTLVPNGNANTWLWASDLWIGWKAHLNLGNFARDRAKGNPFGCG